MLTSSQLPVLSNCAQKVFPTGWWFTSCSGWHVENLHLFPNHRTCKQWLFMLSYDIYYSVWKSCWGTGWQTILGYKSHDLQPQFSLYTNHINSDLVLSSFLILKFDTGSTQSLSSNLGTITTFLVSWCVDKSGNQKGSLHSVRGDLTINGDSSPSPPSHQDHNQIWLVKQQKKW